MHVLQAVIGGLVIGVLARIFLRGPHHIPLWLTILLGMVGGIIGNEIAGRIGVANTAGIDWIRHILQILSAAVLIGVIEPMWMQHRRR